MSTIWEFDVLSLPLRHCQIMSKNAHLAHTGYFNHLHLSLSSTANSVIKMQPTLRKHGRLLTCPFQNPTKMAVKE